MTTKYFNDLAANNGTFNYDDYEKAYYKDTGAYWSNKNFSAALGYLQKIDKDLYLSISSLEEEEAKERFKEKAPISLIFGLADSRQGISWAPDTIY
jgi:hypothetical protein